MKTGPAALKDLQRLGAVYLTLVAVTLVSAATALHGIPDFWISRMAAELFILAIVAAKSGLIALYFMHLWRAPQWLRALVLGWVFAVVTALSVIIATAQAT